MLHLEATEEEMARLRQVWGRLGERLVVTRDEGSWACHIHTDDIGAVLEAASRAGRPRGVKVTDLRDPAAVHGGDDVGRTPFAPHTEAAVAPVGVVAVAAGRGLVELFRDLLAQGVVPPPRPGEDGLDALVRAVDAAPSRRIVVLPNDPRLVPVADEIDASTTKDVLVVPTRSIPQGIAAMSGYRTAEESLHTAAETMSAAASSIIGADASRAVRDATVDGVGFIAAGSWVGRIDGVPVVTGPDLLTIVRQLVRRIAETPGEVVTIYAGEGADDDMTDGLVEWIGRTFPGRRPLVVDGGQSDRPYLLSFE